MGEKKRVHVLSNTHWDREWRFPFQHTRLLLVDLMDRLLDLMEKDPEFKYFNCDSQSIFLEDYLDIRPENRDRLEKLIQDGRLVVGPWYTLPEEYSVSAESLVRNLLMGRRVCDCLGKTSRVGYTPTSYGQISQMAQIYSGFDIDGIMFYRGISPDECTNEYFLEAPDGSRILGVRLSRHVSRGAFFLYIARGTLHDEEQYQYTWGDEGCLSFHLCRGDRDHEEEPAIVRSPYGSTCNLEGIEAGVRMAMEDVLAEGTTDCLVLFDGMDSTAPNRNMSAIIAAANEVNPDWEFLHSSLPLFLEDLKSQIEPEKLTVLKGERRHPSKDSLFNAFLKDSISSRQYLKQRNAEVERSLTRWAEPFSCVSRLLGHAPSPENALLKAWKYLLSCHPHDSIAGLSPDQIHKDMMYRFDQAEIIGDAITKQALSDVVAQIDASDSEPEDVLITVFNPLPYEVDTVPTVFADFPREKEYRSFRILDPEGERVDQQILSREESYLIATEPHEVPMTFFTTKWKIAFDAKGVPPLGFKTFTIRPGEGKVSNHGSQLTAANRMENEFLSVTIEPNGTLSVVDKRTGQEYSDLLYFEDAGEAGDPWMRIPPFADRVYNTLGAAAEIQLLEDGPVLTTFAITLRWQLPAELDRNLKRRGTHEKEFTIVSKVSLRKGVPRLSLNIEVDNTVKDHRLRAMFNAGFHGKSAFAGGQFDVLERAVDLPDTSDWLEPKTGTEPHHGLVCVQNADRGLATLTIGLTEYEVVANDEGTIALTLLRTYGYPKMSGLGREDRVVREGNEGTQCLGRHEYDIGLYFFGGNWADDGVLRQMQEHMVPLIPAHHSRFSGKGLTRSESFFALEPETLVLSTIKGAENGSGVTVRFYNPTAEPVQGTLRSHFKIEAARILKLSEEPLEEIPLNDPHTVEISVPAKKIVTLGLDF